MSVAQICSNLGVLPESDRAEVAAWILQTLPKHDDEDAITDSLALARQREAELDRGEVEAVGWNEFWQKVRAGEEV